jgi:hypothetical protein
MCIARYADVRLTQLSYRGAEKAMHSLLVAAVEAMCRETRRRCRLGHIVSRQPWGNIDLDTSNGRLFLREDWRYHWLTLNGATAWTSAEERAFHHAVDHAVWGDWSNRLKIRVRGTVVFARRFGSTGVPINFDVRRVRAGGQWYVNAFKLPSGTPMSNAWRPNVNFGTRMINLYTPAVAPYNARNAAGARGVAFRATPHEFGHTFDNPDEYDLASPHLPDSASIMNVGRQVRARHLSLVVATLNSMYPGCTFLL